MKSINYSIDKITDILEGELIGNGDRKTSIKELLIDSRKLVNTNNCLFFALKTKRNDGHRYIKNLYEQGLRNFVVAQIPVEEKYLNHANYIKIDNPLKALQKLAAHHRKSMDYPVIAVTGSNGKTIVKEWAYQALHPYYKTYRSPKSYNSQIGVALSVWQMKPSFEMVFLEAGISEPEEMAALQNMIQPDIGIFTNIGEAHGENFINIRHKVGEKLKLFTKVKTLIYSPDHKIIQEVLIRSELLEQINTFTWGKQQNTDLQIVDIIKSKDHTEIFALYNGDKQDIKIPFTDQASIENVMHLWSLMLLLNMKQEIIRERLIALNPVAMRLELKEGINNCSIINDSYNSDVNSLRIALDFLEQQNQHQNKTLILSDILQSDRNEIELYAEIGNLATKKGINKFIGIGQSLSKHADKFVMEKYFYQNTKDFLEHFSFSELRNESILLKGARIFEFEQISNALQQQTHQTVMEVNLDHMIHNLNYFKAKLKPQTKIMLMVKAFSYGSGSYEIANLMQYHRADYLAVAFADEGVELRKSGISLPIMVMSPDEQSMDTILKHDLEPEIYNFKILNVLEKTLKKSLRPKNKAVKIHIKLDTGMRRLGFEEEHLEALLKIIENNSLLKIQSVFSHLAASDQSDKEAFTQYQFDKFMRMTQTIESKCKHTFIKHILNSAGISRFPEYQMDMVRLGLGLYGFSPFEKDEKQLLNINTLKTRITQIKSLEKGETVGYNCVYTTNAKTESATVAIGYADGISRFLGNNKYQMKINGQYAPIIGNVCMDMCMLDVTQINCKEGDEVVVFDKQSHIRKMAHIGSTIPYEILTGISQRVKRVYLKE
jgi:alanine racemase